MICSWISITFWVSQALISCSSHLFAPLMTSAWVSFVTGLITSTGLSQTPFIMVHMWLVLQCRSEGREKRASSSITYCRNDLILSHHTSASTQWDSSAGNKSSSLGYLFLWVPGELQDSCRDVGELEEARVMSPVRVCQKAGPSYPTLLYLHTVYG